MRRALHSALAVLLTLGGCTGTQEGEETVLLVVATDDVVGLVRHARTTGTGLEWLPDATDVLPAGAGVVDLNVARYAGPDQNDVFVDVLYRDGGADLLRTYDATFVPPDDAGLFEPGETTNLTTLVAASDVLPAGEALCTTSFDVSPDGRWLALVHDPAECGGSPGRALLLVDRDEEALRRIEGDVAAPRFGPSNEILYYIDTLDARLHRLVVDSGADDPLGDLPTALDEPIDLAVGPTSRLSLAGPDAVAVVDPDADEPVDAQESLAGLEAVLASDLPEADLVTARTTSRLAVHPDPLAEVEDGEDAYCESTPRGPIADAVVGPFSFAYVLVEGRLEVFDLYACEPADTAGRILRPDPVLSADELTGAVAVDWFFGASPEADDVP